MAVAPYETVTYALNLARGRLNDTIETLQPVSGKLVDNTQAFTQTVTNAAWRREQDFLANLGYVRTKQEAIITAIPAVTNIDPATQVYLNWDGYFDGTTLQPTPVLPQDLIQPMKAWERWSGQNAGFGIMECFLDGIPTWQKVLANRFWEWREDSLYMPGSLRIMDMRLRYLAYLPNFQDNVPNSNTPWFNQPVPIMLGSDALAWWICREIASSRGDDDSAFMAKAEDATRFIMNRDVQMKQRVNVRRQPRSGRNAGDGWGICY